MAISVRAAMRCGIFGCRNAVVGCFVAKPNSGASGFGGIDPMFGYKICWCALHKWDMHKHFDGKPGTLKDI
jgi:hypothetical protein